MDIAIDFDGTIVAHEFPKIGRINPQAFAWMRKFQKAGARLILWTMRSGPTLADAVAHCRNNGVEFFGVNSNPEQAAWTASPKAYAQLYIDDAAFGCPLRKGRRLIDRPMVNWAVVGPKVLEAIKRDV